MIQGWNNNDYLILFEDQNEAIKVAERYAVASSLPGYTLIGLKNWDDFILQDTKNQFFTVPTVPLDLEYLQPFVCNIEPSKLRGDQRYTDKVRWFIKPIAFGGDPKADSNATGISIDEPVEVVKWWNQLYRDVKRNKSSA